MGTRSLQIILLIRALPYGGAETQLVSLAIGLKRKGHTVIVALFYDQGPMRQRLSEAGVEIVSLNKKGRWDVVSFLVRLYQLLRRERPDVLYSFLVEPGIFGVLLKPLLSAQRVIWSVRASRRKSRDYDIVQRFLWFLEARLSRFADAIIVNSEAGREYVLAKDFPATKVTVIPNGIDTGRFRPDAGLRMRMRAELGIGEDTLLIGHVARLDPVKDHETFLFAAEQVAANVETARFACIGGGAPDIRQRLQELSEELGLSDRLSWLGSREDTEALYNAFDLLVLSSKSEGFPNVLCEAMACGVPCISTEVGDARQIVGEHGLTVPAQDPRALADGIIEVAANLDSLDGDQIRNSITSRYSRASMIDRTEARLVEVCGGR